MADDLSRHTSTQFGVLNAAQAALCGFNGPEVDRLCASGIWTRVRHGISWPGAAPDAKADARGRHVADVAGALLAVRDKAVVVAAVSAAVVWGLEWIDPPTLTEVTLACPRGGTTRIYPGLRVRGRVARVSDLRRAGAADA